MAENLPAAPEDEVYKAWLMRGGVPQPAGLFQPKNEGDAATPSRALSKALTPWQ